MMNPIVSLCPGKNWSSIQVPTYFFVRWLANVKHQSLTLTLHSASRFSRSMTQTNFSLSNVKYNTHLAYLAWKFLAPKLFSQEGSGWGIDSLHVFLVSTPLKRQSIRDKQGGRVHHEPSSALCPTHLMRSPNWSFSSGTMSRVAILAWLDADKVPFLLTKHTPLCIHKSLKPLLTVSALMNSLPNAYWILQNLLGCNWISSQDLVPMYLWKNFSLEGNFHTTFLWCLVGQTCSQIPSILPQFIPRIVARTHMLHTSAACSL